MTLTLRIGWQESLSLGVRGQRSSQVTNMVLQFEGWNKSTNNTVKQRQWDDFMWEGTERTMSVKVGSNYRVDFSLTFALMVNWGQSWLKKPAPKFNINTSSQRGPGCILQIITQLTNVHGSLFLIVPILSIWNVYFFGGNYVPADDRFHM